MSRGHQRPHPSGNNQIARHIVILLYCCSRYCIESGVGLLRETSGQCIGRASPNEGARHAGGRAVPRRLSLTPEAARPAVHTSTTPL